MKFKKQQHTGFTLIELLVVIAVILILISISIGVTKMVGQRQRLSVARADIAAFSNALDSYKLLHGDYPWVDNFTDSGAEVLYAALIGNRAPLNGGKIQNHSFVAGQDPFDHSKNGEARKGKHFVDLGAVTVGVRSEDNNSMYEEIEDTAIQSNLPYTLDTRYDDHAFLDPWGNAYLYRYRNTGSITAWDRQGFVLMSMGPDGEGDFDSMASFSGGTSGIYTSANINDTPELVDNIFNGQ